MARDDASVRQGVNLSVSLNKWILLMLGTWPTARGSTGTLRAFNGIQKAASYGLLAFIIVPSWIYIATEMRGTNTLYDQLKVCSSLSYIVMAALKYSAFIVRGDEIRQCVNCIEADWRDLTHAEDERIMVSNANYGRKLITICGSFMYGGLLFYYAVLPLVRDKVVAEDVNLTYRGLAFPFPRVLTDARYSPANQICYCFQFLSGFVVHNISIGACGLAAVFVMHACGQLQIIMSWLDDLVDGRNDTTDTVDQRLGRIVRHHVRVLSFISLTAEVIQEISFVEIVGCTLNICFLGYYSMTEWGFQEPLIEATYIILLTSVTFNIFIFCYIGELLVEQTVKVGEKTYMIDWYKLPGKKRVALILIISMSNSSTNLTAGNLIELSIKNFGDVLKTSFTYLNMLRTFTT